MGNLYTAMLILLLALGSYGISTLLSDYEGPFDLFTKIRTVGKVFRCSTCLSFWISIIVSLITGLGFVETLAVIGGAVALTRHL